MSRRPYVDHLNHLEDLERRSLLKKVYVSCLKGGVLVFVILSSGLALYIHYKGEGFDPVREIQKLKEENRRDEALDMVHLFRENQKDKEELKELEQDLEYSTFEKIKSFTWNGIIKGEVFDSYSGLGALSADLCIVGDIRDLGIQSWKYLSDREDFDRFVLILSAAGLGLSSTPFINGCDSLAKNIIKYLKKIPRVANKGVLKKFLSGTMAKEQYAKVYDLLKKTAGQSPEPQPAYPISTT
jgi:hypothetical protein